MLHWDVTGYAANVTQRCNRLHCKYYCCSSIQNAIEGKIKILLMEFQKNQISIQSFRSGLCCGLIRDMEVPVCHSEQPK